MSTGNLLTNLIGKTALQVVAEMQPDGLAALLDLLLDCLDDAIGQVQAHIQQCTCQDLPHDRIPRSPCAPRCPHHTNGQSTLSQGTDASALAASACWRHA